MKAEEFVAILQRQGVSRFTGVPCSFFQAVYTFLEREAADRYIPAANEGIAMALAAGTEMAGQRTAVLIQNSGLGNLLNPLTSLHVPYRIPGLLFVSGRAFGVADEPQHQLMGRITDKLLERVEAHVQVMDSDPHRFEEQLARHRDDRQAVRAFIVPKGTIATEKEPQPSESESRLSRLQALEVIAACLPAGAAVLSTTGLTSRDWITVDDHAHSFYAMGSMGHVMSIALGVALTRPEQWTIVLDGDGSLLMHLGGVATIGAANPQRLLHVVIDNGRYESTGNQRTTSESADFAAIAKACGYRFATTVDSLSGVQNAMRVALDGEGPKMIRIKVGIAPPETGKAARVTDRHSAPQIAERFSAFLQTAD